MVFLKSSGFGSQFPTGLRLATNGENLGIGPGLGINGLPGFPEEKRLCGPDPMKVMTAPRWAVRSQNAPVGAAKECFSSARERIT